MRSYACIALLLALGCLALPACGAAAPGDSGPAAQQQPDSQPYLPFSGLTSIELLTPANGAGEKPLFEWAAVEGAARYSLILQFTDGQPYWAWSGSQTSVYLGGTHSPPAAEAAGPALQPGMAWAVLAFDAQQNIIAASQLQAISP